MANKQRGEVNITLGGTQYTMRPTFNAMCEIEDALGISIIQLSVSLSDGNIPYRTIATIVYHGIKGHMGDKAPTYEEVGQAIMDQGYISIIGEGNNPVVKFLMYALTGKEKLDEEESSQAKKGVSSKGTKASTS